ncbi:hypothetical protein EYF80_007423 [Liparis tanakae]|uniref:Uncharacterized protein n=1 Tax=Liparis tanakae TaxID=230148 RepID=A0A4Z2IYC3_9TELE|nr:hypothetical protein EYF80_007423 [Liparis tanakae]
MWVGSWGPQEVFFWHYFRRGLKPNAEIQCSHRPVTPIPPKTPQLLLDHWAPLLGMPLKRMKERSLGEQRYT